MIMMMMMKENDNQSIDLQGRISLPPPPPPEIDIWKAKKNNNSQKKSNKSNVNEAPTGVFSFAGFPLAAAAVLTPSLPLAIFFKKMIFCWAFFLLLLLLALHFSSFYFSQWRRCSCPHSGSHRTTENEGQNPKKKEKKRKKNSKIGSLESPFISIFFRNYKN